MENKHRNGGKATSAKALAIGMVAMMLIVGIAAVIPDSDVDADPPMWGIYGMGRNSYGQQGDGTTTDVLAPTMVVQNAQGPYTVSCSNLTTFYIADGKLYGIGSKKKYFHSIFHFFCLIGSALHFFSVYLYVL